MRDVLEFAKEIEGLGSFHATVLDRNRRVYNLAESLVIAIEQAFNLDVLDEFMELWRETSCGENGLDKIVPVKSARRVLSIDYFGPEGAVIQNKLALFEALVNTGEETGNRDVAMAYDSMLMDAENNLFDLGAFDQSLPNQFSVHGRNIEIKLVLTGEAKDSFQGLSAEAQQEVTDDFFKEFTPQAETIIDRFLEAVDAKKEA